MKEYFLLILSVNWILLCIGFTEGQCNLGLWGDNCRYNCSKTCNYGNNCTQNGGECGCEQLHGDCYGCTKETYGLVCNLQCNKNCSLSDQCIQTGSECGCDKQFGYCNSCPKTLWGQYCDRSCSDKCLNSECDRESGECTLGCRQGFYGSDCSIQCDSQCSFGCDQSDGQCFPSFCVNCLGGLPNCDQSTQKCKAGCIDGFFGDSCDKTCSTITNLNLCTKCRTLASIGITVCSECQSGYYHEGVSSQCLLCSSGCHVDSTTVAKCFPDTGNCRFGCTSGWFGPRCDQFNCTATNCDTCALNQPTECTNCQTGYYLSSGQCMKCSDNCQTTNTCDKTTGTCTGGCKNGWYGNKCIDSCTTNCLQGECDSNGICSVGCSGKRYGQKCDSLCSNCFTSCNRDTGLCDSGGCVTGFHGNDCLQSCHTNCLNNQCNQNDGKCTTGCKTGYHGDSCQLPCSPSCGGGSCDRTTGSCGGQCTSGKYGEYCNLDCPSNCNPLTCNKVGGDCTDKCNLGFYGSHCNLPCPTTCSTNECEKDFGYCSFACPSGKYGTRCDLTCSSNCNGTQCDRMTGTCSNGCESGYYGNTCQDVCSRCDTAGCIQSTGVCIGKCISGFYDNKCDKACSIGCLTTSCEKSGSCGSACKIGYYGDDCRFICSSNCNLRECVQNTGECSSGCVAGKYGTSCDIDCGSCTTCDQNTGACQGCPMGKYGTNCQLNCSYNCGLSPSGGLLCDRQSGNCLNDCKNGWYGSTCNIPCNNDIHCIGSACNQASGHCSGNCVTGWYGSFCDLKCSDNCVDGLCDSSTGQCTKSCKPGFYGTKCTSPCVSTCTECHSQTGACTKCKPGHYGPSCERLCSSGCIHSDSSSLTVCNKDSGSCNGGCANGWYGLTCLSQCSTSCFGGTCDIDTGRCDSGCSNGKYGEFCQNSCQNCAGSMNGNCNVGTGVCLYGCADGYFGSSCTGTCYPGCKDKKCGNSAYECSTGCENGLYGSLCTETCSTNCQNNICDRNTGTCSVGCKPGWFGEKCKYACPESCAICDRGTGSCVDVCTGSDCQGNTIKEDDKVDIAIIIGATIAGAVVLLIVIIIVCCFCLRKKERQNGGSEVVLTSPSDISFDGIDNHHYQNFDEIKKDEWVMRNNGRTEIRQNGIVRSLEQAEAPLTFYEVQPSIIHQTLVEETESDSSEDDHLPPPPSVHFGNFDGKNGIQVEMFPQYVEYMMKKDAFGDEYEDLPEGLKHPHEVALRPGNKSRNRYRNIFPYDHSRVILQIEENDNKEAGSVSQSSDYINASYIDGYNEQKAYIACQGPTDETADDFWRMVWQHRIQNIVMLTNLVELGQVKCKKYWPDENKTERFGNLYVKFDYQETFADFVLTNVVVTQDEGDLETDNTQMSEDNKRLQVKHLQFTSWPDRDVPKYVTPLIEFYCKVKSLHREGPLLVHCSAGVGRSGTFIGLDFLLDQADSEGLVNLYKCVERMRIARPNMVQTPEQYTFLHQALSEALLTVESPVDEDEFENYYNQLLVSDHRSGLSKLQNEFEQIKSQRVKGSYEAATSEENKHRNRHKNILASDECRVFLWSRLKGCSDYINAIYLPSYRNKYCFIATEMPQCATIVDFCRMIFQEEVRTIVMLDNETAGIDPTEHYWPEPDQTMVDGPFSIKVTETKDHGDYIVRSLNFKFAVDDQKGTYKVNQFHYKCWSEGKVTPTSVDSFVDFVQAVTTWQSDSVRHPIIVHCMDGATKVGLFCMVRTCLDRIQSDGDVSIVHSLHHFRARRSKLVPNFEQYRFAHECVLRQLSGVNL